MNTDIYFNIHGLLTLKISGDDTKLINYIQKEYAHFITDEDIKPDITVFVSDFIPENENCYSINKRIFVKKNYFFCYDNYKTINWCVCIKNIETIPVLQFKGGLLSEIILKDVILEPLISYKLGQKGIVLLHASSISIDDKGYIFAGHSGVGKTTILLNLSPNNCTFFSDEISVISNSGIIYSYPAPIRIFSHNLKNNTYICQKMTVNEKIMLELKRIIQRLSMNYIKFPQYIMAQKLFTKIGKEIPLYSLILLSKTTTKKNNLIRDIDKRKFVEKLIQINKHQFSRFSEYLSIYSSFNPESDTKAYWFTMENNLVQCVSQAHCYEMEFPLNNNYNAYKEFMKVFNQMGE